MLNFLKYHEINKQKWDLCILNSLNCKVYAFSWYLDSVSYCWDALVYGDYEMVFPIVYKKRFFCKKIYHPLFCQQLGPFTTNKYLLNNHEFILSLLIFLDKKYSSFEFSINHRFHSHFQSVFIDNNFKFKVLNRINLELDLSLKYQELRSSYRNHHKRYLNKYENQSFLFDVKKLSKMYESEIDFFLKHFKKHIGVKAALKQNDYLVIQLLLKNIQKSGDGTFVSLKNNSGKLLAGAIFITNQKTDILLFNFSDLSLGFNSMLLLVDYYIRNNAGTSKILDFEGSNLLGVRRFYEGFGSVEKNYLHIIK